MNIQLPTGRTINVSYYEYLFLLSDDEMKEFYQQCIADDLGSFIEDPFHGSGQKGKIDIDNEIEDQIDL